MIEVFKKIWKFSGDEQKQIKKAIVLGFFNAVFHVFQIGAIYVVVQAVVSKDISTKNIWYSLGLMIFSIVGKIITNYFSQLQHIHAGFFMSAKKRIYIGNKMKLVPMGYFNKKSLGNIIGVATTVLGDVENTSSMVLIETLGGFITSLVFAVYILIFDWRIGSIASLGIVLYCIVIAFMEKKSRKIAPKRQVAQAELVENVLETVQGMSIVKSFNLTNIDNKKIDKAIENSKVTNLDMEKLLTPYTMVQQIILRVFSILIITASLYLHLNGKMELTFSLMFIIVSFIIFEQLESAGSGIAVLRLCGSSIEEANQLDNIPVMDEKGKNIKPFSHEIEFENVGFSYEKRKILKNINVKMKDKSMIAVVGPSGSGKTTMCNLIARFWDVNEGSIKIGGYDVKKYTLESLMNQISMVFQNIYLFHDTIENNICFGKPEATREEVIKAAKKACCHEFIEALPNGYDSIIGEKGFSLSGGEKQRISIARAILKNAPIIIFDEATANVDPENEGKLQKAIEELTKNKTIIMIAHRLKTIRNADQIIVLDDGKIVQNGKHEELIKQKGIYANFISNRKQASDWKLEVRQQRVLTRAPGTCERM